ncbi:MAG: nicotinate-nucleotide adenylyltransferase [Chloroflexi bacterium]|nr:nicotinate-nucleotide adenylyltransferase [Chloroflexota bacterium]
MKRGILGGTFNPVHLGHLIIAADVAEALSLDRVVFVPAGAPWMKSHDDDLAPAEDRWRMVSQAVAGDKRFEASRVDIERKGLSYAVDTVRDLRREAPGDEYVFIMGMDSFVSLPQWESAPEFAGLCRIAVVQRPGYGHKATQRRVELQLPACRGRIEFVKAARIEISSTDIRKRVREGRSIRYRVPEAVAAYIAERRLYR